MTIATIKETHPCRRELTIEIPPEEMAEELSAIYQKLGKESRIPGFRPGKAPRRVLEKYLSGDARVRAMENRLQAAYEEAVRENELRVLGEPEFKDIDWPEGEPMRFTAGVEISPAVELPQYRGLELTPEAHPVTEADIDRIVDDLRRRQADYITEPDRPAAAGDWALVDYRDPGRTEEDWVEGAMLEISDDPKNGVGSQLIGLAPGEIREVSLPAPEGDGSQPEPPQFPVRLREIKKQVLPEADDELARKWGEYDGMADLRRQIGEDIARSRQLQTRRELEVQAMELLLAGPDFPLPPSAEEKLAQSCLEDFRRISAGEKPSDEELAAAARRKAQVDLKSIFVLREIVRVEELEVDPRALGEEIARLARREGVETARMREALEARGQIGFIRDRLLRDRALDFVIEQARIKE